MNVTTTDNARTPLRRIHSTPRRFDLATIFAVTTAYCLLFGALSRLGAAPAVSIALAVYITLVGIGQALLFGGRRPRTASIVVGVAIFSTPLVIGMLFSGRRFVSPLILGSGLLEGALFGYLSGVMVGGVFLIADVLRRRLRGGSDSANARSSINEDRTAISWEKR